jgi:hypothetical protein
MNLELSRRGFLGGVIGSVLSARFLALPDTAEWQRVVLPYRMLFRDSLSGHIIQAPGVMAIQEIRNGSSYAFVAEPLVTSVRIAPDRVILMNDRGHVIVEGPLDCRPISCNPGDTLNVTANVSFDPWQEPEGWLPGISRFKIQGASL